MNTHSLAKLYDQLTARERLPLIIAAGARGDDAEQKRLSASAPQETYSVPHHFGLAKALQHCVDLHQLALLDLAAKFWQWWGMWMLRGLQADTEDGTAKRRRAQLAADEAEEVRSYGIVRFFASRFVNHVDGWKRFCATLHVEPLVQLEGMLGWQTIQSTEANARKLAFTADQAACFVASETTPGEGPDAPECGPLPVDSAEALAKGWHAILDELAQRGGGHRSG